MERNESFKVIADIFTICNCVNLQSMLKIVEKKLNKFIYLALLSRHHGGWRTPSPPSPFHTVGISTPIREREREKREWSILIAFCWKLTRILKFAMRIISNQFFRYDSLKVSIWRMQIKHFYKFYLSLSKQNIPWRKQLTWCHTGIRKMHYHIQCTTRDS